ncbi:MAG: hypothetical protein PVF57_09070 [Pseudomonadales bacterium]
MKPNEEICGDYLHRYHLIPKNRFLNVYLHRFQEPDPGRDLHDHPWWSVSIVLKGRYVERFSEGGEIRTRTKGGLTRCFSLRKPTTRHTITWISPGGCWTIFVTGPKIREWGFHTRNGWVHNQTYEGPRQFDSHDPQDRRSTVR